MHRAIAITHSGFDKEISSHIHSLIGKKPNIEGDVATFSLGNKQDLIRFSYLSQAISQTGFLFIESGPPSIDKIKEQIKKLDFSDFVKSGMTFSLRCISDNPDHIKLDVEKEIGGAISNRFGSQGYDIKVDLTNPDLPLFVLFRDKKSYLYLDFAGFELDKRDYKVFVHRADIKGPLAYLFLLFSGYSSKKKIIDPFSKSGTIPIEAALHSAGVSPHLFIKHKFKFSEFSCFKDIEPEKYLKQWDERKKFSGTIYLSDGLFKNINASKKNAKIADINKCIKFSKTPLEDLDLKFRNGLDMICTCPPQLNKYNKKEMHKIYRELFHQAGLILREGGKIAVLLSKPDMLKKIAKNYPVSILKQIKTFAGKKEMHALVFELQEETK